MARAQGARAQLALAFESTYGTPPGSGFTRVPFASSTLSAAQSLLSSELLGYGRDPLAPIKDSVTVDGAVTIPIDAEAFGFWLKGAFGAAHSTSSGRAAGSIEFSYSRASGESLTLTAHAVYLPRPRIEIAGPQGV